MIKTNAEVVPTLAGTIADSLAAQSDSVAAAEAAIDVNESLDKAEYFYAIGARYYQVSQLDSAQAAYEQSLALLSELDLDPEDNPEQAARMERLLNEIEQDYRLTLMSSGKLYSESSVEAFRELFDNLKNFKNLKESGVFHEFNKADTTIYDVNIEWNEKVENSLIYLQTVAREKFNIYLARSAKYLPLMEQIFREEGLPHDIVYLPLIESGFNASAFSYARASGFWQFISSTGQVYGLDHNWWFDERRDFEKSTRAAARHLRDLYNTFGSWNLALAAYNGGAGRVSREIKKSKTNDFWKLQLHSQTKNYVPLFMAATIIAKQPQKYGFFPSYERPIEFDTLTISKCLSFESISSKVGIPVSDLEMLNPELLRGVTPPSADHYLLRIPKGRTTDFWAMYDSIPSERSVVLATHRVRKGETIKSIARKYGVTAAALMEANNLSKKKRLYSGQTLTVPVTVNKSSKALASTDKAPAKNIIVKENPDKYRVKSGDTLWEIAAAYGVSIAELKRANNLSNNNVYAGRWLKVPSSGQATVIQASVTTSKPSYSTYKVKRGDTLGRIAGKKGLTLSEIKDINNLKSSTIYPGMVLKVPSNASSDAEYAYQNVSQAKDTSSDFYTVRQGDTLWKIARSHDVEVGDLAKWNNISQKSPLIPGDKLKIYYK